METQMKLEHRIDFRWLILFALPTIFSSIFANLYSTVDGIFVALYVDTDALSAINITMPMTYLASALGMMFGSGGNALVARKIGEGRHQEAREDFSLMMAVAFGFSVGLAGAAIATSIGYALRPSWARSSSAPAGSRCFMWSGPNGAGKPSRTAASTAPPRW